jgi:hypothetical protein
LIITIQLNLFVARSPKPFFLVSTEKDDAGHFVAVPPPSIYVFVAVGISLTIATFIAVYWDDEIVVGSGFAMEGIGWRNAGLIWAWAIVWFIIIDMCKYVTLSLFDLIQTERKNGLSYQLFFTNVFALHWDRDRAKKEEEAELRNRRANIMELVKGSSILGEVPSNALSSFSSNFGIGLAAITQELGEGQADNVVTFQVRLYIYILFGCLLATLCKPAC